MTTPGGRISQAVKFNVSKLYQTSLLITDFPPLPTADLILQVIDQQQQALNGPENPSTSSTSTIPIDVLSQRAAASLAAFSAPPPQTGPPVISSPVPYVINNGTTIVTHPTITTNGVTDPGLIYHGRAVDGPVSAFAFTKFLQNAPAPPDLTKEKSRGGVYAAIRSVRDWPSNFACGNRFDRKY